MTEQERMWGLKGIDAEPVFAGLAAVGITGRDAAKALRVSPATVSKWRRGHTPIPPETVVFLTLMLADQVERLSGFEGDWSGTPAAWGSDLKDDLALAKATLAAQEIRNRLFAGQAVCDGARRFRIWWNAERIVAEMAPNPAQPVPTGAAAPAV